jgi:hypothetical protein
MINKEDYYEHENFDECQHCAPQGFEEISLTLEGKERVIRYLSCSDCSREWSE